MLLAHARLQAAATLGEADPARMLCTAPLPAPGTSQSTATALQQLLAALAALPVVAHKGREGPPLTLTPVVKALSGSFPARQAYPGLRTDVVAVLANVSYRVPDVQQVCVAT